MLDFRIYFYVQTLIFQKNLFVHAWNGVREENDDRGGCIARQTAGRSSNEGSRKTFSDIAMPLGGLGLLQDAIIQLAGIQRKPVPIIRPRAAVIFCADNGVVAEG